MKTISTSPKLKTELITLANIIDIDIKDFKSEDDINELLQNCIKYINKLKISVNEENVKKEPKVKQIISKAKQLGDELNQALYTIEDAATLKKKNKKLSENINREKEKRDVLEKYITSQNKKIELLVEHIEKLVTFLRVENTLRTKAFEANRSILKENKRISDEMEIKIKAIRTQRRAIEEVSQGSKILEDQLLLMDTKYLELKQKLDAYREQFNRETRKMKKEFHDLRIKYSFANNGKILDAVKIPNKYNEDNFTNFNDSDVLLNNNTLINSGKKENKALDSYNSIKSPNEKWNTVKSNSISSLQRPLTATSPKGSTTTTMRNNNNSEDFKRSESFMDRSNNNTGSEYEYEQIMKSTKSRSLVSIIRPHTAAILDTDHILDKIKRKSFNSKRIWDGEELTALLNAK